MLNQTVRQITGGQKKRLFWKQLSARPFLLRRHYGKYRSFLASGYAIFFIATSAGKVYTAISDKYRRCKGSGCIPFFLVHAFHQGDTDP